MKYPPLILAGLTLLRACVGFGQAINVSSATGSEAHFVLPFLPPAVMGAPYAGEELMELRQTLSDGTHIRHTMMWRMLYRDSLGRTREERPLGRADDPQTPILVEIADPIAGVQYVLDTQNKVAHRVTVQPQTGTLARTARSGAFTATLPPPAGGVGASGAVVGPPPPEVRSSGPIRPSWRNQVPEIEKLGTRMIEGVLAEGERSTFTIPEGEQGNDQPIRTITETWTSPELKMVMLRKSSDPRSGEFVQKMLNLSRTEPDASLFQAPPEYTIVDEATEFTVHFGN